MSYKDKIYEFNKRWDINLDSKEAFNNFKVRLLWLLERISIFRFNEERRAFENAFYFRMGIKEPEKGYVSPYDTSFVVFDKIENSSDLKDLSSILQNFFFILSELNNPNIQNILNLVNEAIDSSPGIEIRLIPSGNEVLILPSGSPLLDEHVINENLLGLSKYKGVSHDYEESLKLLVLNDPQMYRDVVDKQRYVLESLLKQILGNNKAMSNQRDDLGKWLKMKGTHTTIRTNILSIIIEIENYNKDWVRHPKKGGYQPSYQEVEYVIYQTGTIMRLLLQLAEA